MRRQRLRLAGVTWLLGWLRVKLSAAWALFLVRERFFPGNVDCELSERV